MLEGIGFYCGLAMRWLRDALCDHEVAEAAERGVDPYTVMDEVADRVPPGSNGVVALISNVMDARHWVHASPSFVQLDLNDPVGTGRAAWIRAVEESAAYVSRAHRDLIGEITGREFTDVVFTGGASKGKLWPQVIADVLGIPVQIPEVTESSSLGTAIAAGTGVGVFGSLTDAAQLSRRHTTVLPSPPAVADYEAGYLAWQDIYRRHLAISEEGIVRPLWRAAGADLT
jgi:autoinducer 2 (AI-2) kinase